RARGPRAARGAPQLAFYRRDHAIPTPWPVSERILVCVSPSPFAPRVVRAARRMAAGLRAEWIVANVETPAQSGLPQPDRDRAVQHLRLAEQLGAETATLTGHSIADEIVAYARRKNVSKIVIGKPAGSRWRELIFGSVVNDLVRKSGDIDVYVITGERGGPRPVGPLPRPATVDWPAYAMAAGVVAVATGLSALAYPRLELVNLIMIYLLGVVLVATRASRGPSIAASLLSV